MTTFDQMNKETHEEDGRYRSDWQKHHVIPVGAPTKENIEDLFLAVSQHAPHSLQYIEDLFDINGLLLPTSIGSSLAHGFARHAGAHHKYTPFVERIISDILGEYESNTSGGMSMGEAATIAAKTLRGFQAYLIDGLTISEQVNPLTDEKIAHAQFFLNNNDFWLNIYDHPDSPNFAEFPNKADRANAHVFGNLALDDIRGGVDEASANMSLPFWQGYHSLGNDFAFAGFGVTERDGTIYDPYFTYDNGAYASSVERFIARERGVGLAAVTDFADWQLGDVLSGQSGVYDLEALMLDDVVFFQNDADYSQTIADLTMRLDGGLGIEASQRADTLLLNGSAFSFGVDLAIMPHDAGWGLLVSTPTEQSVTEFLNVTDELLGALPDSPAFESIRKVFDDVQSATVRRAAKAIGIDLAQIDLPQVTVASDAVSGLGHDGVDLMLGLGSSILNGQAGDDWMLHTGHGAARAGDGDDVIFGFGSTIGAAGEALELHGDDGDDTIFLIAGEGGFAYGGAGEDILFGGGAEAHLYGGADADKFFIGANTTIHDAETSGDSVWMGLPLFGGVKQWWMEGTTAYWAPFSTMMSGFPVIGSAVLTAAATFVDVATMKFASYQTYEDGSLGINIGYGLGGVAKIEDYRLDLDSGAASGGVVVFEVGHADTPTRETFTQFINLALKAGFGVGFAGWDPIVLDLDGDGYELTTQRNSGVYFEFDSDGFAEKTGWVRPDDGFLVLDANANGIVDDAASSSATKRKAALRNWRCMTSTPMV